MADLRPPCSRCRKNPRQARQQWCRQCRTESQRRKRAEQAFKKAEHAVKEIRGRVSAGPVGGRPERVVPPGGRWPLTQPGCCANCDGSEKDVGALLWTKLGIPLCLKCYCGVLVDPVTKQDLGGVLSDLEPAWWPEDQGGR